MSDEVLVKVEGVSKKFCRSLKRSLWYGVQDVTSELMGRTGGHDELRKNEFWAVNDVSFELKRGECLGLIGPNGAGKSTLLKMLNGLVKPDKGRIIMRGRIGALIELGAGFNPILTGRENIYVNGSVLGFSKKEIDRKFDAIVDFAEIEEFIDSPVQNYSSGMKVRLGFAVAAQMEPDVLLIDEILSVGDAAFRGKCFNRILGLIERCAVIFVSHAMAQIGRVSTSVAHMDKGQLELFRGNISTGIAAYSSRSKIVFDQCNTESRMLAIESIQAMESYESIDLFPVAKKTEKIEIRVTIRVKEQIKQDLSLLIVLIDNEMQNIAEIKRPVLECRLIKPSTFDQVVTVDKCQLSSGKYYVSCALLLGESGELGANCQYGTSIVVDSGWSGYAAVRL